MVQSVSLLKERNTTYALPTHIHMAQIQVSTYTHMNTFSLQSQIRNAKRVTQNRVWRISGKKDLCTSPASISGASQTFDFCPSHLGHLVEDIILLWAGIGIV